MRRSGRAVSGSERIVTSHKQGLRRVPTMDGMDPRRLLIFRTVVRNGSIGAGARELGWTQPAISQDRKSTRLNSSHVAISYAVFCLKKKKKNKIERNNLAG